MSKCSVGGELVATADHKPDRADEGRRIRAAGGSVAQGPLGGGPMRVDGTLAVSRALGDFHFKPPDKAPGDCKVTSVPEVQVRRCRPGDWILMACDGIFDVVTNEEVKDFIESRLAGGAGRGSRASVAADGIDGGAIVTELLQTCLDRGSKDNCTACLVQLRGAGPSAAHARELVQGPWEGAPAEIRAKYAEFFASRGFQKESRAVQVSPAPAGAGRGAGAPGGVPGGGNRQGGALGAGNEAGGGRGAPHPRAAQQIVALAKALSAMRNARGTQGGGGGVAGQPRPSLGGEGGR
eukprot:TRINITY_DN13081_c1_g1_i2.p1 TRINITY_DN13081_c1_g1~~TRINITY_DN13081_c1_g1_i2.p1  ORF type:complete len:294 (-),score=58.83 TRINITY_DN13081_c1_g1_i2:165-1046(-)